MIEQDDQNKKENGANEPFYNESDNEYGLPEAEYSPIQREQPETYEENRASVPPADEDIQPQQKNSSWPMWVALGAILLLAGLFVYFFVFDTPKEEEQFTQQPIETPQPQPIAEEEPPVNEEPAEEDWNPVPEVKEGSVATLSSRTGRYHMIVGSFIDGDLARDFAQNLADEGYEAKIIEPSGTRKFYRLSVKDAESIADLNPELESMKAKFGENVWIVKY